MAYNSRQRMIHPEIWESESFCSFPTDRMRLAFICLFSGADDEGKGRSAILSSKINFTPSEIKEAIQIFEDAKSIFFYFVEEGLDQVLYYQIPKWFEFQRIDRPSKSKIPNHPDFDRIVPKQFHETYRRKDSTKQVGEVDRPEVKRSKEKLSKEKHIMTISPSQPTPQPTPEPIILSTEESQCWLILSGIENFPPQNKVRVKALRGYINEFADIDPVMLCNNFAAGKIDKPLNKKGNPILGLRTFFVKAREWGKPLREKPKPIPKNSGEPLPPDHHTPEELKELKAELHIKAEAARKAEKEEHELPF